MAPETKDPLNPCPGLLLLSASLCLAADHEGLDWLIEAVPGVPGEDYPIYAQVRAGQPGT